MENEKRVEQEKGFGVVLLIEDDDIVMEVGRSMIEKLGYTVIEARTGDEAIQTVRNHQGPIDLALLDMDVAGMKGEDIYPYLAGARPDMPVVVCTGELIGGAVDKLLAEGARDTLQKPFSLKTLENLLVKYVDRRNHPRIPATEDFLAVSDQKGVYSIRIIDISKGGLSFACDGSKSDEEALVDVAVLMAEKGVNLDDLECRVVSDKDLDDADQDSPLKRKSVSFGRMTREQFEKLSELINACSKKD